MAILFACMILSILFAPWLIAMLRGHPSRWAIFFTLLFFGWTIIGYGVAFIWACGHVGRRV